MKNVLDPCCKCPEALCLMAGAEEGRGERARPSPRPLDLEAEDAGHSVADDPWLHAKKKKKGFRDSFELLPLLHRIDIDVGHRSPRIFTTNVESYVAGERQKARIRVGWCR